MVNKSTFGQFLRQKRNEKGMTQKEFAEKLFLSESAISKWEKGKSYPDITMIPDICSVLDISEHELISGANDTEYHEMKRDARVYRKITGTFFWGFTGAYALALIICFICDLAVNHRFTFFPVVFGSLLTAFSFVPTFTRFTEKHKLAVFTGSTYLSLVLLFVICCAKYGQNWFGAAALGTLLGYIAVFAPFLLRRYMPARGRRFIPAIYFALFFACSARLGGKNNRGVQSFGRSARRALCIYSVCGDCRHAYYLQASADKRLYRCPRVRLGYICSATFSHRSVRQCRGRELRRELRRLGAFRKRQCISAHFNIHARGFSIIARGRYCKTAPRTLTHGRLCNIIYQNRVDFSEPDGFIFRHAPFRCVAFLMKRGVILQNRKLKIPSEVVYILAVALLSLAVAMLTAANFGVSMIVAPAYLLSLKAGILTFGQAEYVIQAGLFIIFCIVMRGFRAVYLSSFVTCLIYGAALDLWRCIPFFNPNVTPPGSMSMPIRILLFVFGVLLTSFSVAMFYKTYLYPQVYDFFVKGVSGKFGIKLSRFKTCFDLSCLAVAAIMSLAFFRRFEGIGWGTLVIASINGTIIGFFCRLFDKYFDFTPLFKKFAAHFELGKKQ
mgnify:CR=1 FL=1